MSFFLTYSSQKEKYILNPAGYLLVIILFAVIIFTLHLPGRSSSKSQKLQTRQLVFCSSAMALAMITSFIKIATLPYGGSVTLFSMMFICLIGYIYGARTGVMTGAAYGILRFIIKSNIYAPFQVLIDYPLAFGVLGLSGLFSGKKHGLVAGYAAGVTCRYLCHVVSGYIFFSSYTPEGMNPMIYTLGYNATYILPEMILTIVVLQFPSVVRAIRQVKYQAVSE